MNKINNQVGFSLIELALIILVLGLVGFSGWWVYANQHKTVDAKTTIATSIAKTTKQPKLQYLIIKELGIKLPLATGIDDLIYAYNNSTNTVFFSTTSLDQYSSYCVPNSNGGALGFVQVETSPVPASRVGSFDEDIGILYTHVNGYYLYWKDEQSSCLQTDANNGQPSQAALDIFNTQYTLLQTALKSAVTN